MLTIGRCLQCNCLQVVSCDYLHATSLLLVEEACQSVAGHDSFLGDVDPFAQPELYSLIEHAEGSDAI